MCADPPGQGHVASTTPARGLSLPTAGDLPGDTPVPQEEPMSAAGLIQVALMTFVLLAPTLMVAVLVSGISRRPVDVEPEPEAVAVSR